MSVEELGDLGMVRMDEAAIADFLANQTVGILGLPAEDGPYMVPMSFGFDGASSLYLVYALGAGSRKEELTERADAARFLVYKASSPFEWESVLLTGTLVEVPAAEWAELTEEAAPGWRPDLLERADLSRGSAVYRFRVEDRVGLRHAGLPPEFDRGADGKTSDES